MCSKLLLIRLPFQLSCRVHISCDRLLDVLRRSSSGVKAQCLALRSPTSFLRPMSVWSLPVPTQSFFVMSLKARATRSSHDSFSFAASKRVLLMSRRRLLIRCQEAHEASQSAQGSAAKMCVVRFKRSKTSGGIREDRGQQLCFGACA